MRNSERSCRTRFYNLQKSYVEKFDWKYAIFILLENNSIRVLGRSNAFICKRARQNQKKINLHINLFFYYTMYFFNFFTYWRSVTLDRHMRTKAVQTMQKTKNEHYINNSNWLHFRFKPVHTCTDLNKIFVKSQLFL